LFGASNQLLAALALIGVSVWLKNMRRGSKVWLVSFLPAVFMFVISDWSLIQTAAAKQAAGGVVPVVSVVLIVLSAWIAVETGLAMFFRKNQR
jgi:carbon starvation protein